MFYSNVAPRRKILQARKDWKCASCGAFNEKYWSRCPECGAAAPR